MCAYKGTLLALKHCKICSWKNINEWNACGLNIAQRERERVCRGDSRAARVEEKKREP